MVLGTSFEVNAAELACVSPRVNKFGRCISGKVPAGCGWTLQGISLNLAVCGWVGGWAGMTFLLDHGREAEEFVLKKSY